jgi:hypothetical protein
MELGLQAIIIQIHYLTLWLVTLITKLLLTLSLFYGFCKLLIKRNWNALFGIEINKMIKLLTALLTLLLSLNSYSIGFKKYNTSENSQNHNRVYGVLIL